MLIMCACRLFLFVNDTAEQATWASTLQSHEGVLATLAKLVDVVATITGLGTEAQRLMTKEVMSRVQVRPCFSALSFEFIVQVIPLVGWHGYLLFFSRTDEDFIGEVLVSVLGLPNVVGWHCES